ncbi:hypothetical protein R3P38DRAFT_2764052 [Favolaschia claudopus]|uniref:Uncharacterized protein n=1 Tax=Favolaschia claudopus TaxID=2862362 RepID=A0AAW0DI46_9AGAR
MSCWIAASNPCIPLLDCLDRGFLSEAAEKILDFGGFRRGSGTTNLNVLVGVLSQTLTPAQTLQFEPIPKPIGAQLIVVVRIRSKLYGFPPTAQTDVFAVMQVGLKSKLQGKQLLLRVYSTPTGSSAEKILDFGGFRRGSGTTNLNVLVGVLSQTLTPAQTLQFEPIPKPIGAQLIVVVRIRSKLYGFPPSQYSKSTRPVRAFAVTLG